jgi:radical SAM superfamily enzyme YgiQ (UPF0313 family)
MRILLVHAEFPITYWGMQYGLRVAGKRTSLPPLGLITVAALLPASWEVRLVDMNVERLEDDQLRWADVVLVGGMLIQERSMREVLGRARRLGRRTVVGGPAPSTAPERFSEADVVFGGEVEGREAKLIALIEGRPGERALVRLRKDARPDIQGSPMPRFDLLRLDAYASMAVQFSRGCPFRCEFCDIIEIFGRVPRLKTPAQLLGELDELLRLGWQGSVFIVDDNFIGNVKQVRRMLPLLSRWQEEHRRPMELYTEASVNLAADPALVAAMVEAGFTAVFLGIETPSAAGLEEVKKTQNLRLDLAEAVQGLTRAGLEVMSGFIVGFDSDDATAFAAQRAFLEAAPIPMAMIGLLTALPGTALWRRLDAEGRLRDKTTDGETFGRPNFATVLDEETLVSGYAALLSELYSVEGYLRRCRAYLELAPAPRASARVRRGGVRILLRALWQLGMRSPRRRLFWSLLAAAARRSPAKIPWAIQKAIQGEHLVRYTTDDVLPRLRRAGEELRRERRRGARGAGDLLREETALREQAAPG